MNKTIHYCWFGGKELPQKEQECIKTWKKFFPDYDFQLWNEENVDLDACAFVRQAYDNKKFAFVSDYVRTKILYEHGGVYFDTDVEVLDNFESLFQCECLLCFEGHKKVGTAVIYTEPRNPIIGELLKHYEAHQFDDGKGNLDTTANTVLLTDILLEKGMKKDGTEQWIDNIHILPRDYFYPKKEDDNYRCTERTVAIHKFSGNWLSEREKKRGNNPLWINVARPILQTCRRWGQTIIGKERIRSLEIKIRNKLR